MLERSLNQRACIRIIHVIESASTPSPMTGADALRLQVCHKEQRFPKPSLGSEQKCNRRDWLSVISYEAQKSAQQNNKH